jgi:RimJ/RimL family protein N-acetyltransferase
MSDIATATDGPISIRRLRADDLPTIANHPYSVAISEPCDELDRLHQLFAETGMWQDEAAAVAITDSGRMIGTVHCYRSAPCIHGLELGYLIHDRADRGKGSAGRALRMFSDHLFEARPQFFRQQLIIEVWNTPSWHVGERAGFVREGILRSCGFGEGDPADAFVYSRTRKDHDQQLVSLNSQ